MNMTSQYAKKTAKGYLKGNWPQALMVMLVVISVFLFGICCEQLVYIAFDVNQQISVNDLLNIKSAYDVIPIGVFVLFLAFSILAVAPVMLGAIRWFFYLTAGRTMPLGEIFYYFSSGEKYRSAVKIKFGVYIRTLGFSIAVSLPSIAVQIFSQFGVVGKAIASSSQTLSILASVLTFWFSLRYILTYFIFIIDPKQKTNQIISRAVKTVYGYKSDIFGFIFSFFGWYLLCTLVIPVIFILPYFICALCIKARSVIAQSTAKESMQQLPVQAIPQQL